MYSVQPPRLQAPDAAAANETVLIRTYKAWKGSNIFLLGGRLIFGPDVRSLFLTIFLIAAPIAIFCIFVVRKLMDDFPHYSGISIMVIVVALTLFDLILLMVTSGRDPGIIPRNTHPPEPEGYDGNTEVQPGQTPPVRLPRTKDVVVNGILVRTKYCDTCMLYRPPRCSHCSICNNCVEKFDHHCPWVGQCIGLRNYRFFFMFVFSSTLLCLYVHGFCWVYIVRIMNGERTSIWKAMAKTPASIALVIYTFISVWFVGGLTIFHLYLISTNQSTYENFRYRYDRRTNPFNRGIIKNFMEVFCTGIVPSKNNFRAKVQKEPTILPRTVGCGFASPMGKEVNYMGMAINEGRKPVWDGSFREADDSDGSLANDDGQDKDGALTDASLELSRITPPEDTEGRSIMNPRHASWGRRSGSWDISPGIARESKRYTDSSWTQQSWTESKV